MFNSTNSEKELYFNVYALKVKKINNCLESFFQKNQGTGSYPLPPQGLHDKMRFNESQKPFIGPCFLRASMA